MFPFFSVIMAVYNHEDYVEQAVRSVLAQTLSDWELVVVNDGSTDASPDILERLAAESARIVLLHQNNAGAAAARNRAVKHARARWLAYLDSDDLWFPETLASYQVHLEQNPEAQLIYGFGHRLRGQRIIPLPGEQQDRSTGTQEFFQRMFLNPIGVCHRRELWDRVGGFDAGLRSCEDYEFFLRVSLLCRFEPLGKATGLHRRHETNISRRSGKTQEREAEVLRQFVEEQGGRAVLEEKAIARRLSRLYLRAARQFFKEAHYRQAIAMIQRGQAWLPSWRGKGLGLLSRCLLPWAKEPAPPRG